MSVEDALGVPIFYRFPTPVRVHPECIMGVEGKVADRLSQAALPFTALEFVRSDESSFKKPGTSSRLDRHPQREKSVFRVSRNGFWYRKRRAQTQ